MLPLGKAGVLSAEGGAGKTQALVQLAIAVITGRPWLGHFAIGADAVGRRVLLALGEEDLEETHRRVYDVARALGLAPDEREAVARLLVVLPLAGEPVALLRRGALGGLEETPELVALRRLLTETAGPEGWALVVVDPLSRWCGPDAEADNGAATRTVQALESLVRAPGGPTVLAAAHSSKLARRAGSVDTRGVTGITDGLRWEGTLRVQDDEVYFRQAKSNYSRPMPESREVQLVRGAEGVLRVPSPAEVRDREASALAHADDILDRDVTRIVDALERHGEARSQAQVIAWAGLGTGPGRLALAESVTRGLTVVRGPTRDRRYARALSPHTPRESESARLGLRTPQGGGGLSPRESARVRESAPPVALDHEEQR